ncbi:HutD/Ves family protein [Paludibacterium yongneupense]|uniref:HutD/Ves family protein n=1 Tax=Paludibacterium yongneupense TaxID=400061 RepID=UPI0003FD96D0|nr:HutD family protein [Paludibacterium yongneupense]
MAGPTLIRAHELIAAPWKNGGGSTREIACFPAAAGLDDFIWRASLAEVAQAGPFSRFDGVDRTLILLAGAGMRLETEDGVSHRLAHALDRLDFAGETAIHASPIRGATHDFNLMLRRDAVQGEVEIRHAPCEGGLQCDVALLFCVEGELEITLDDEAAACTLSASDTLRIDTARGRYCRVRGQGCLLRIGLNLTSMETA